MNVVASFIQSSECYCITRSYEALALALALTLPLARLSHGVFEICLRGHSLSAGFTLVIANIFGEETRYESEAI